MPILHKFYNVPPVSAGIAGWDTRFETHNAILDVIPYEPEVMFIGTFNHGWPWNQAHFFYGRNYLWPIFNNYDNDNPLGAAAPIAITRIFELCEKYKMTFADVVKGTNGTTDTEINTITKTVTVTKRGSPAPFAWKGYSDKQLNYLGNRGCLDDNVEAINKYICDHPSIKFAYFTWGLDKSWLSGLANLIKYGPCANRVKFCSILSPSGNGFGDLIPGYPDKIKSIMHAWIWTNHAGPNGYVRPEFCHLAHNWLTARGVNPALF